MDKKVTDSIRIYREQLKVLDKIKAEMRDRGDRPSYADLIKLMFDGMLSSKVKNLIDVSGSKAGVSTQREEIQAFEAILAAQPELAKAYLAALQVAISGLPKVGVNGEEESAQDSFTEEKQAKAGRSKK